VYFYQVTQRPALEDSEIFLPAPHVAFAILSVLQSKQKKVSWRDCSIRWIKDKWNLCDKEEACAVRRLITHFGDWMCDLREVANLFVYRSVCAFHPLRGFLCMSASLIEPEIWRLVLPPDWPSKTTRKCGCVCVCVCVCVSEGASVYCFHQPLIILIGVTI
jgi:hypothetical protein